MKRVLTALLLVPFALFSIFWAPWWFFNAVATLFAFLCYREFTRIARNHGIDGPLWLGYVSGVFVLSATGPWRLLPVALLVAGLSLPSLAQVVPYAGAVLIGTAYTFGAWRCAIDLHAVNSMWVLYALAINWVGDVAAYYVGRTFGRHKLAPIVSPGKSWEGAVGSMAASIAFGVLLVNRDLLPVSALQIAILSLLANVSGQLGDLAESAMKRGAGLKDSGTLLPGHGGFLDRLDSSLFTLPVVYYAVVNIELLRLLP